ncbi:MAG: hypothetical protein AB7F89_17115 [Pirellulaceae bacterium]
MKVRIGVSILAVIVVLSGCGESGPKLVPVEGTATVDGKPLAFKSVFFHPDREAGTEGNGAGGFTNGEGKYYLIASVGGATSDQKGCPPGKYTVTVTEPAIPISEKDFDSPQLPAEGAEPGPGLIPGERPKKSDVPAAYTMPTTSTLKVEVPEAGGTVNLELKSS